MKLKIKKLSADAVMPKRATAGSAAFDLCAANSETVIVPARGRALVPTGIAIELPDERYVALVFARSGLAIKKGIGLSNGVGVIDSDYRGEVCVGLCNDSDEPFEVKRGDRIAQLMITELPSVEAELCDELADTARGAGGFGSTGRA